MTLDLDTRGVSDSAVVAELAEAATEPAALEPGTVYAVSKGHGNIEILSTDAYAERPRRAESVRTVHDAASFNGYFIRHKKDESEVWADTVNSTVVGIIDAHGPASGPGWEKHRVNLVLEKTKPWLAWTQHDGHWFDQLDFAEFIDQRAIDVVSPGHLELVEMAQHFQAHRNVEFKSSERAADGQIQLNYEETVEARAGQRGDIKIPESIQLVLRPYVGGPPYYVAARFRYRIRGTSVVLGYLLERPQEILDAAFADIVELIRNGKEHTEDREATPTEPARVGSPGFPGVGVPIYYGRP